jgi:integrase
MNENVSDEVTKNKTKRSSPRYWVEIKGKLYARLQYKADDGKYKVKYKSISDKRTARSAVEEMRRELEVHGEETLTSDKMTFKDLAEKYEDVKLIPATYQDGVKVSGKRSIAPVKSALNALLPYFERKLIRNIKTSDIESYKQSRLKTVTMRGSTMKVATINRELSLLRTMLNFALQNEWIIKNPFILSKGVISMSAEVERDRILSFDEEKRLLAVCHGRRFHLKALLICALDTAMRRGEIFKMKWEDVNFDINEIHIPQTNTKTEDARIVGITPRLRNELELLWETSPKDKSMLVFGITNTIKTSFTSACKEANILDFRFHDCRHTATTRMIASGSPHTEVMKITGHTQLKTFLRYLNITTETATRIAANLSDYLAEKQNLINDFNDFVN